MQVYIYLYNFDILVIVKDLHTDRCYNTLDKQLRCSSNIFIIILFVCKTHAYSVDLEFGHVGYLFSSTLIKCMLIFFLNHLFDIHL